MKNKRQLVTVALLATSIVASVLFFNRCESSKANTVESEEIVVKPKKKNCDSEYMQLSIRTFSSCAEAIFAFNAFLDEYSTDQRGRSCCEHARKIKDEYGEMKAFLEKKSSYEQFIKEGEKKDGRFASSPYETVRKTWASLYRQEKNRRYNLLLDEITAETFKPYLEKCAKQRAREYFDGTFVTYKVTSCEFIGVMSVSNTSDRQGKKATGTFHVKLEGADAGLFTRSADVTVSGIITVSPNGTKTFVEDVYYKIFNKAN